MARQKLRPLKFARGTRYAEFNQHVEGCSLCRVGAEPAADRGSLCVEGERLWSAYLEARGAVDAWQRANSHLYAGRGRGAPWRAGG